MKTLLLGLLVSLSAFAEGEVYFANSSLDGTDRPFCVTWVNAAMPTTLASAAHDTTAYSCRMDFNYRERIGAWDLAEEEQQGTHTMEYVSVPGRRVRNEQLRSHLKTNYGYVLRTDNNGAPTITIMGEQMQGIFASAQMLNDVFSFDLQKDLIMLKPRFSAVNNAREVACQVVALELLQLACEENRAELSDDILKRLRSTFHRQQMRNGLIPQARDRNP